jgi:hypothetical protein
VIEENLVSRVAGVRIGEGSLYDWVVEEILATGGKAGEDPGEDVDGGMAMAALLLADLRKRRLFTAEVERAFDAVEREMRLQARPRHRHRR